MTERDCASLRKYEEDKRADKERGRVLAEASSRLAQERRAQREKARAEDETRREVEAIERRADLVEREKEQHRLREKLAQDQAREEAEKQKRCGADFMSIRVGMTIARFESCTEALSRVTTTVDARGEIEIYRATYYIVHVLNGRVVSYTRRRY